MKLLKNIYHAMKPFYLRIHYRGAFKASLKQRRWDKGLVVVINENGKISIGEQGNFRRGFQIRSIYNGNLQIGDNVFCNTNVSITSILGISIGSNVKIANNVVIVDHDHNYKNKNRGYHTAPVVIGDNVWIGANAVILKGVTIGENAVIAAGSVVKTNIPKDSVAAGVPACVIKTLGNKFEE